jgi:Cu2+-exporting ATPase
MDVPVALALVLAYVASVYNTVTASGQTYFDSVTMFIFLLSVGRYIEMTVRRRSLTTSEALGKSLPSTVSRLKPDNTMERVSVHDIVPADRLSIPRGAVIPVDAALASDVAFVDEALITGESTPVRRSKGDRLLSGSVNTGDAIQIIAQQNVAGSTLASIVALLERAQSGRPRLNSMADRAASWFVGAVLIVSIVVAVVWWFIDPSRAFPAALAVLVVTCPCALSLATPVATAAATVRLARLGMLVTRADTLERLARVDTVVLDKTGTLTMGDVRVQGVTLLGPYDRETSLAVAAALERVSDHPLAQAFAPYSDPSIVASGHREIVGSGVEARVGSDTWRLGRHAFVAELFESTGERFDQDAIYLASTRGLAAAFEISQDMRPDARAAIQHLKALKLSPVIASGDRTRTVLQVACALGIDFAVGRLSPENKLALVRDLQSKGHRVLMIGDGVNDGPVLAAADVSCAMGQGSAVAQAAADTMLLRDSLAAVAQSIATSRRMIQVMRQNLGWSIVYNFSAVPLAAMNILPPWVAALGMSISSLFVVLNASRIK